ncbi:MAG: V-type ATP synthase subunit H [Planctomycetota bacterium]
MSDVIQRLLEVEKEARRIIEEAEQEADRIARQANREAEEIREQTRNQAREDADGLVQDKLSELQQRKQQRLKEAAEELPSPEDLEQEKLDEAVRLVTDVITARESARQ